MGSLAGFSSEVVLMNIINGGEDFFMAIPRVSMCVFNGCIHVKIVNRGMMFGDHMAIWRMCSVDQ